MFSDAERRMQIEDSLLWQIDVLKGAITAFQLNDEEEFNYLMFLATRAQGELQIMLTEGESR